MRHSITWSARDRRGIRGRNRAAKRSRFGRRGGEGPFANRRLLLGSVSDHVATHAPCSTLVVRPTGLHETVRPIRVCLAFETSGSAIAALQEIAEVPWKTGTDFHLLTVETYLSDFIGQRIADEGIETRLHYQEGLLQPKQRLADVAPKAQNSSGQRRPCRRRDRFVRRRTQDRLIDHRRNPA